MPLPQLEMTRPALLLLLALSACATVRPPAPAPSATTAAGGAPAARPPEIVYEPEVIAPAQVDLELTDKNDEELFAIGSAAYGAGDFRRAAAAFARIADVHPQSSHAATAVFDAGLSYQKLEEWRLALERFRAFAKGFDGPDAVDAEFRIAQCLYHLDELDDARALLRTLADRPGLEPELRIRALAERGVVELEAGKGEEAERTLQLALQAWREGSERESLDEWHAAQAQFYLGEVYREWFRAIPLVPKGADEAELAQALENKAQMLLTAQGHYIRAIRMQNEQWAVAAGFRCGELYDELRRQMLEAPLPPGLSDEEAAAYRDILHQRLRILAEKAIVAYEQTLALAARARVDDNRFLEPTRKALDEMRAVLADKKTAAR
ncbi:MAG TPA: tetratricopeptide repeat protein [Anaeromyxobacteraceae bacterium]|nr:tetratricopeptide repeat protein [Anaeromyxobacteraceae bacterium]